MKRSLYLLGEALCFLPDWIVNHFPSRARRAFGFWTFIISVALSPIFGRAILFVTAISLVALIPNFTTETPVEVEKDDA